MSHINAEGQVVTSFKTTQEGTLVYPITNNLADVFIGRGFLNGARMRRNGSGWTMLRSWGTFPKNFVLSQL